MQAARSQGLIVSHQMLQLRCLPCLATGLYSNLIGAQGENESKNPHWAMQIITGMQWAHGHGGGD